MGEKHNHKKRHHSEPKHVAKDTGKLPDALIAALDGSDQDIHHPTE